MSFARLLGLTAGIGCLAAQTPVPSSPTIVRVPTRLITKADRPAVREVGVETFRLLKVPLLADATRDTDPPSLAGALAGGFWARGKHVRLAVAWKEGERLAQYGVDADGDGTIAAAEVSAVAARVSKVVGQATPRVQFEVPLRQKILGRQFGVQIRRLEDGVTRAEVSADIDYREGVTDIAGISHTFLVLDGDDDGTFGSDGDHFAFLPTSDYARVQRFGAGRGPSFRATEPAILGDRRAHLIGVDAEGFASLRLGAAEEPLDVYLARRQARAVAGHLPSLRAQEAGLAESGGFDPAAPPAEPPIPWLWVLDADAALTAARAAGKPLFLVYGEETDERCAMMDLYTWPSPAVVEALAGFVCARVSIDLDVGRTWERYQVRFGPAYVFVAPDGRHLQYTDRRSQTAIGHSRGFKAPAAMVTFVREQAARLTAEAFDPPAKK